MVAKTASIAAIGRPYNTNSYKHTDQQYYDSFSYLIDNNMVIVIGYR